MNNFDKLLKQQNIVDSIFELWEKIPFEGKKLMVEIIFPLEVYKSFYIHLKHKKL